MQQAIEPHRAKQVNEAGPRPSTRRRIVGALAGVVLACVAVVGALAVSGSGSGSTTPRYAQTLVPDLCALRTTVAETGAIAGPARSMFFDRLHEPLHALARDLNTQDRAQAARLLEAKQVIEALLSQGTNPQAARDVDPLIAEAVRGLTVLDVAPAPSCLGSTS